MGSKVFFAQLDQHLLMSFVRTDVALETKDGIRKVSE